MHFLEKVHLFFLWKCDKMSLLGRKKKKTGIQASLAFDVKENNTLCKSCGTTLTGKNTYMYLLYYNLMIFAWLKVKQLILKIELKLNEVLVERLKWNQDLLLILTRFICHFWMCNHGDSVGSCEQVWSATILQLFAFKVKVALYETCSQQ